MERVKNHWRSKPEKGWRIVGLTLIALLLALRLGAWWTVEQRNTETASQYFDNATQAYVTRLSSQFEVYAGTLYSGRALFLADRSVARADWTKFVEAQNIKQRYPGVIGLSYVTAANRAQVAALTSQLNANRTSSEKKPIAIYPATTNDRLAVVTYLAPQDSTNQGVIGFDLLSSQVRGQMLDEARDTGLPRASGPLALVGDVAEAPPSFLEAIAVYREEMPLATVDQRRAALLGYVILSLHSQPLLDAIFKSPSLYSGVSVSARTGGQAIYQVGTRPTGSTLQKDVAIGVAGETWQLTFRAPSTFGLSSTARLAPSVILLSTIPFLLILLAAFYFAINLRVLRKQLCAIPPESLEQKDN